MVLNHKTTKLSSKRMDTVLGRYIFSRQKELILDLVAPRAGERCWELVAVRVIIYIFFAKNGAR